MAATKDQKILFKALGFMSVILGEAVPQDQQARRALAIAQLIEDFCMTATADEGQATLSAGDKTLLFSGLLNDNNKNRNLIGEALAALQESLQEGSVETSAVPPTNCLS